VPGILSSRAGKGSRAIWKNYKTNFELDMRRIYYLNPRKKRLHLAKSKKLLAFVPVCTYLKKLSNLIYGTMVELLYFMSFYPAKRDNQVSAENFM
jgi:hypothetical protein